jgi:hypothetical protein
MEKVRTVLAHALIVVLVRLGGKRGVGDDEHAGLRGGVPARERRAWVSYRSNRSGRIGRSVAGEATSRRSVHARGSHFRLGGRPDRFRPTVPSIRLFAFG